MGEYLVQDKSLTAVADAIRAKNGGTDKLTLAQMPEKIAAIQTGTDTSDATASARWRRAGAAPLMWSDCRCRSRSPVGTSSSRGQLTS